MTVVRYTLKKGGKIKRGRLQVEGAFDLISTQDTITAKLAEVVKNEHPGWIVNGFQEESHYLGRLQRASKESQ